MKPVTLQERACDCCGSRDFEEIYNYSIESRTKCNTFFWNVRNVVCKKCGFAFVSPSPIEDVLEEYYSDSFSIYSQQTVDFSIENRMHVILKCLENIEKSGANCLNNENTYIEVGSNNCPEFIEKVNLLFDNIKTVEINDDCHSSYSSLQDIPDGEADVIAAYFVLEHVPQPKVFLKSCARSLKSRGFLILEVPNLYLYPKDPAGIFLHEHVNHFSPISLAHLANEQGLLLKEISQKYCSRPFGFVAVFQKTCGDINSFSFPNSVEYVLARSCMAEGVEAIKSFKRRLVKARERINQAQRGVIIWGANEICKMLLDGYQLPTSAICIDSDSRKEKYLLPLEVCQPSDVLTKIETAELLVINTKRNSGNITEWITKHTGRNFTKEELLILDYL